jgi:hypothetical protein
VKQVLASRLILGALLAGCSPAATPSRVVERDSSGIRIVENNEPEWAPGAEWVIEPEPVADIGAEAADTAQQLYLVVAAVGLGTDLAVANLGSGQVLRFGLDGALESRTGRRGAGPREFSRLSDLYRCAGDTLLVNDYTRMITLDARGEFVRTVPIRPAQGERTLRVRGVAPDCSTFVFSSVVSSIPAPGAPGRRTIRFAWGTIDGSEREEIGVFQTSEVVTRLVEEIPQPVALPWGADGAWAVGRNRFYYGSTDHAEFRVYTRAAGLSTIVRWAEMPRPITQEDRRLYAARREWLLKAFPPAGPVISPLEDYPDVPALKPIFRSFILDDAGNLWVRRYPAFLAGRPDLFDRDVPMRYTPPPGDPEVWNVFDAEGRWLGEVRTPADLVVKDIDRDRVIGVWKDTLDVEHVRAYRLRKPGNAGDRD